MTEPEPDPQPKSYDAIVILGRSIGKELRGVKQSDGTFRAPRWRPSSYFGFMTDRPVPHSGIYDNRINPAADKVMVAGGNACILAASYLYEELALRDSAPRLVVFAAGRPPYLENEPANLSEGGVLQPLFSHRIRASEEPEEMVILAQNKSTQDDIEGSIQVIREKGLKQIAFLTVKVHTERSKAFLDIKVPAEVKEGLDIDFLAAETILGKINARYRRAFEEAEKTPAYEITTFYENRGRNALIAGNY